MMERKTGKNFFNITQARIVIALGHNKNIKASKIFYTPCTIRIC